MYKKKNNAGVLIGIFTLTIELIVVMYKYLLYTPIKWIIKQIKNHSNKISTLTISNLSTKKEYTNIPVKSVYFKVAGITYGDRQELIKKMLKSAFNLGYYEKYDGMTNAEIKDCGDTIYEANNIYFNKLKLLPTKYEDKNAIEVYVDDLSDENKLVMVGYVPKRNINEVLYFLNSKEKNPEYKYKEIVNLTGGKGKRVNFDDEIERVELNYGIDIVLEIYEQ